MPATALVDANSICHRLRHAMGDLSYNEQAVGIIYGFLRQILTIAKRLNTNQFIFCWDSVSRKRLEIYPQYKANRRKDRTEEEKEIDAIAYSQFTLLRKEILPKIGFKNNFYAEGYESDDIIAKIVQDNSHQFIIVSTDSDLFQLLNKDVSMLISNDKPLYTKETFIQEHQIDVEMWPYVKAISGCNSDGVVGVRGVGDKTAIKYLRNELNPSSKSYKAIKHANEDMLNQNLRLVRLPFKGLKSFCLKKDKLSIDAFLDVCNYYQFYSLTSKDVLANWRRIFFGKEI